MVDNDANTAAWAEWRFGAGRGEDHLVMITLGTGIGGAILEDGQVKRGKYGVAGEFGHMQVVPGGHRCPCGNRGCWEQYSSGNALVREARELAAADSPVAYSIIDRVGGNIPEITGPLITELAREGDAMCIELLQDIGQWLGVGIANLAAALDPSCFVIGGGVSAADDLLIGPARDAFRRHLTGRGYRPEARIAKAQLGPEAGMVGAADLARLVARRFRRANRRRVERYERYERAADNLRRAVGHADDAPRVPRTRTAARRGPARGPRRGTVLLTLLIVVLLIAVPAGYLVISAEQSRDSGEDKQREGRRHQPHLRLAQQVQRSVYEVPLPLQSSHRTPSTRTTLEDQLALRAVPHVDERPRRFLEDVGTEPRRPAGRPGDHREQARRARRLEPEAGRARLRGHHLPAGRRPSDICRSRWTAPMRSVRVCMSCPP